MESILEATISRKLVRQIANHIAIKPKIIKDDDFKLKHIKELADKSYGFVAVLGPPVTEKEVFIFEKDNT